MTTFQGVRQHVLTRIVLHTVLTCFVLTSQPGIAALTEVSSVPLASTTSAQVKPNIMYLMDTSGSMAWSHMPDDEASYLTSVGYKSHQCNSLYYNPNVTYALPKKADGTNMAAPSFTSAKTNGFSGTSSTVNLSTGFYAYDNTSGAGGSSDTAQAAYYYLYSGAATLSFNTAPCTNTTAGSFTATPSGTWTKVIVSSTSGPGSTDERQNFANWFSYYRTRILMMKSAATLAFNQLTDSYRVGFVTINPGNPVSSTYYLPIADFNATQRTNWFAKVTGQSVGNSTPLREALSRVGRHYAGMTNGINSGMTGDPVQYSCQQNFTILTTDGYWNTGNETVGPVKTDGTTSVGNQDSDLSVTARPMWDGGIGSTSIVTDKSNTYRYTACTATQRQQRTTQIQKRTVQNQQNTAQIQSRTTQVQTRTTQIQQRTVQNQQRTQQVQQRSVSSYTVTYNQLQSRTAGGYTVTYDQVQRRTAATYTITYSQLQRCSSSTGYVAPSTCPAGWTNVSSCTSRCQTITGNTTTGASCTVGGTVGTGGTITACAVATWSSWANIASCSASSTTQCQTLTGQTASAASCTVGGAYGTGGTITACAVTTWSAWANAASCAASATTQCQTLTAQTATAASCTVGGTYGTGGTVTACTAAAYTAWANATTCTASATVQCQTTDTGWVNAGSCTPSSAAGQTITCQVASDTGWTNNSACTASNPAGGPTVTCQTTDTGWVNTAACTAGSIGGQTITCQTTDTGWVNASSCTASSAGGQTVTCQTTNTGWTNVATCTPGVTGGQTITCQTSSDTGWTNASSCTASAPASGPTVTCQTTDTGWVDVASCTASGPTSGRTVTCQTLSPAGQKIQYQTTTTTVTTSYSGGIQVGTPITSTTGPTAWADTTGTCYASGLPSLPATGRPTATLPPAPPGGCAAWPCTTTGGSSGGASNTLADVAQYYYNTDLRPAMVDNVPAGGSGVEDDKAEWQHMTTFTMGLGISGTLTYNKNYKSASTGDFADLRNGTKNWPTPVADDPTAIDDLWHAAVNGRGQYFSAGDPNSVIDGLATALASINARVASAAAAATSNLEPVAGDNFAYTAKYKTLEWSGELEAHEIDLSSGAVLPTVIWSAAAALDATTKAACDNRTIKLFRSGATDNLVNFTWNTYACDGAGAPTGSPDTGLNATEQAYFGATQVANFSQYPTMTDGTGTPATANQRLLAQGAPLVNFIRGQRGKEGYITNDANALYRSRVHILGDIVNAQPVYVKAPFATYTDSGYSTYKTDNASRTQMVYVAANDGMLHAFYAGTSISDTQGGQEAWSFIPTMALPRLYKLADDNYANLHQYTVDGTPSVGDIYDGVNLPHKWKTILVAGLNAGGQGYYALDISDPLNPKGLWEFKWSSTCYDTTNAATMAATSGADCHIGYTFNDPLITKLADGTWVVIVTSGINNVNSPPMTGDGIGYLYVLNAATGKIMYKISTGAGSSTTPSGLNHTINWVESTLTDNTTVRVYGVDLLGNVWRFDVNDSIAPAGREATLIGTAKDPSGNPQPISTRPEVAEVSGKPMVFVATGKLLGYSDETDTQVQSIYGIIDPLTATTGYTNLRGSLKPLAMTVVGSGASATRTIACTGSTSQCNSPSGWVADLPDSGERVNVDMKLQLGTIVVASNVPRTDACTVGGYSWLNYMNYATGTAVSNSAGHAVSQKLSESLAVGLNIVRLPSGKTVVITTTSDAKQTTVSAPFDVPGPTGKRVSWRELAQ